MLVTVFISIFYYVHKYVILCTLPHDIKTAVVWVVMDFFYFYGGKLKSKHPHTVSTWKNKIKFNELQHVGHRPSSGRCWQSEKHNFLNKRHGPQLPIKT